MGSSIYYVLWVGGRGVQPNDFGSLWGKGGRVIGEMIMNRIFSKIFKI